jgi:5-methylcytosine-specific restriction endonuclease McrA
MPFNVSEWEQLVRQYGGRCAYCDADNPTDMDHVRPLSRGGPHSISNVAPACRSCNASKSNRTVAEWRLAGAKDGASRRSTVARRRLVVQDVPARRDVSATERRPSAA